LVYVPPSKVSAAQRLQLGDIVVAMSSGSKSVVGKTAQVTSPWDGAFGAFCGVLRTHDEIDPKYVGFFLRTQAYRSAISDMAAGTNINNLKAEHFERIEVPIAPLAEQRRIVAALETILAKVAACRDRLARIPTILRRFRQSVLAAACSGRLTADWREQNRDATSREGEAPAEPNGELPNEWALTSVGEVIENLKYGTSKKCEYEPVGAPVLRIPNVVNGVINQTDLKYAKLPHAEFEQLRLREGDLLLIRSNGSVSLVGTTAIVGMKDRDFAYAGYLMRLRPKLDTIMPQYLNIAFATQDMRFQIELNARSTSGVNNINSEEVRSLRIALPPLPEQQEIVRRVDALFAVADAIEARYEKARKHVERLTQSVLATAFRGELVPTEHALAAAENRTYESASALLERIKSAAPDNGRPKRKSRQARKR
jgi:type I restriction enzyme S subunit